MSTEPIRDEQKFITSLYARLDDLRDRAEAAVGEALQTPGTGSAQSRLERDIMVAEQSGLLAAFNAGETGLCFGRLVFRDGRDHHIGRIGLREDDPRRTPLVVDWRAEVARPFYLATGHEPMGLTRRRHITTRGREVVSLHDEVLDLADRSRSGHEGRDADEVLLAALDAARTGRMHDIVQTIQAEQDAIIRTPHRGVLVVEGGPGTGKTAVALHRAAYLLYAHREQLAKRAVLIVGPNPAFLGYIGNVLPSLGETGVLLATPGELYPGVRATGADTPRAASVKGDVRMAAALAEAVRDRQQVPERGAPLVVPHEDGDLVIDWDMALEARHKARETALPHNLARPYFAFRILDALAAQLADRIGADPYGGPNFLGPDDIALLAKGIAANPDVHAAIDDLWPELTPEDLLAGYLAEPTHLPEEDAAAIRRDGGPWTPGDVPLLDEAAELLGHDDSAARAAQEAERQRQVQYAQGVLDVSFASRTYEFEDKEELDEDASEVLSAHDIIDAERFAERQEEVDHRTAAERAAADRTWAFGHIIVDEAQELSAMQWRLLMRRSPTRSMTLVGDPAQTGDPAGVGAWDAILAPYVEDRWQHVRLGVNYRTPAEIMAVAAAVRRADDPSFEPPGSVRSTGVEPWDRTVEDPVKEAADAVAAEAGAEGRLAVIAPAELLPDLVAALPDASYGPKPDLTRPVVLLDPRQAKGLEFDTVLVVDPDCIRAGAPHGTNDLYVALTRATQRLGIVRRA
ncbi:HelD family protein [Streptomyces hydrogenans]|uniref:DNA helicase n=1 Tax=Streptomyces hydrogenans TaxID=1873719 RepID=A0ABQ3P3J7_9ACTN|nr:UvrD-helicase domain-containing protein [Streptomyces hydrogenans]GHG16486.1 DNA helicase [Streptomyces hydrogenans]GHI19582.1 DNA helicase [Streptomyces hydrogenans]